MKYLILIILVCFASIGLSTATTIDYSCLNTSHESKMTADGTDTINETIPCRYGCDAAAGICRDTSDMNFSYLALSVYILLISGFFVLAWFFKEKYPILTVLLLFMCLIFLLLSVLQVIQAGEQFTALNPQVSTLQTLAYGLGFIILFIFAMWILYLMKNTASAIFTESDDDYEEEF